MLFRSTMHTKQGEIITTPDGQQYFQIGNTRIKITEHFASNGKQVDAILEELILSKSKDFISKNA